MAQAAAGDQDHINGRRQEHLKLTKALAENPFGPVSSNGVPEALGGNDPEAPQGRFPFREQKKIETKKSAFPSCSGEADLLKIRLRCNVLVRCKPHGAAGDLRHSACDGHEPGGHEERRGHHGSPYGLENQSAERASNKRVDRLVSLVISLGKNAHLKRLHWRCQV